MMVALALCGETQEAYILKVSSHIAASTTTNITFGTLSHTKKACPCCQNPGDL